MYNRPDGGRGALFARGTGPRPEGKESRLEEGSRPIGYRYRGRVIGEERKLVAKMLRGRSPRFRAGLEALLVTFLWSTSWILIKVGLKDIPALSFAGLRYTLACLVLLPFAWRSGRLKRLGQLPAAKWLEVGALGLFFYAVTQGAQFMSLAFLPAMTTSLLLSFTTILVAFLGIVLLGEKPTALQWAGTGLYLLGITAFFCPISLPPGQEIGFLIAIGGTVANALSSILGRHINRDADLDPMAVTVGSMAIGGIVLLAVGAGVQGIPRLSAANWLLVLWLAVVNSAVAFTLWNRTLQQLSAMESSIINNTMLFQIALLAWLFLGEALTWQKAGGMILAAAGTLAVQLRERGPKEVGAGGLVKRQVVRENRRGAMNGREE
jgi:drug/metabolite transporter (DMT)-like permease